MENIPVKVIKHEFYEIMFAKHILFSPINNKYNSIYARSE
jgi:hypothetical protein